MCKRIASGIGVLAAIAGILGLLVALNIIPPFPSPKSPTPTALPTLIVTPSSIKVADCKFDPVISQFDELYDCQVALTASGENSLNWAVSGGILGNTTFTPQKGTLEPGQSASVIISIGIYHRSRYRVSGTCPTTVNVVFTNKANPSDTHVVTLSC